MLGEGLLGSGWPGVGNRTGLLGILLVIVSRKGDVDA